IQTSNGGSTAGRMGAGDTITYTYNQEVKLSTISSGWTGTATTVTARLRDGNLIGLGSTSDAVDVLRSGATVNLGSVNLKQNYIKSSRTAQFAATMTASTTTVNGVTATRVVLVLGTQISGQTPQTSSTSSTMVWTPSTVATDLLGRPAASTPASELGTLDREF
ncbi:MAG: fibronectin, partial [Aeromicrobium sp.]|nr:fibronectin [Aeromicrobium sp.]